MLKVVKLIIRVLVSFAFASITTEFLLVLIQDITKIPFTYCEGVSCSLAPAWPVYIIGIILTFIVYYRLFKSLGSVLLIILLLIAVGVTFFFFARPFHVSNGQVGKYAKGQTVFSMSTKLIARPLQRGDYVIYSRESDNTDWFGWIELVPGDKNEIEDLPGVGSQVSEDQYIIHGLDAATESSRHVVGRGQIRYLIWYP